MAAIVKRFTYDEDRTGRNPANLIRNERHTITPQNRTPQNVLIPGFAPFYRQSLIVTDMAAGLPLREGIDYTVEWPILDTSDNTEGYTPLYMGIQFVDNGITGQFELQYQTIGGQWALDGVKIAQALANTANDPLTTTYADLIGRPIKLPPLEHVHSIDDFVGFGDLCNEVGLLREAIEILAREDKDSHPGYETLVDHYFELDRFTKEINTGLEALDRKVTNEVQTAITNLTDAIRVANEDLTSKLNTAKSDLESKVNALRTSTNNAMDTLRTTLNQTISRNKTELTGEIDKVKQSLATAKSDLESKVNALRTSTNNTFNDHDRRITAAHNAGADWRTNLRNIPNTIQYSTQQYLKSTSTDSQHGGFELNKNGRAFRYEVTPNNNFKLYRAQKDDSPAVEIYFQGKSGTVALLSDIATAKNELQQAISALQQQVGNNLQQQIQQINNKFNEYVRKAGDTMTGKLTLPRISVDGIEVWKNSNPPGGGNAVLRVGSRLQVEDLYIN